MIVVDPPRKGCDRECLETMLKMRPERIVYVSCDSATLARDLRMLCDGGYELKRIRAVDQFGGDGAYRMCGGNTKETYLEILYFKQFYKHFVFVEDEEGNRNKRTKNILRFWQWLMWGVGIQENNKPF